MIVRISTENQYVLSEDIATRLNEIDNQVVSAVDSGDEATYKRLFGEMLTLVRSEGTVLGEDELEGSDVILPPPDLSLAEAKAKFTGDGLIPD